MAASQLVLSIDVGTSAIKAAIFDRQGKVCSAGSASQRVYGDVPGAREHDPAETWLATTEAIHAALRNSSGTELAPITAVAITGPRGSFCLVGEDGATASSFLTWQDQRGSAVEHLLSSTVGATRYRALTGMSYNPFAALSKLVWMQRYQADLLDRASAISTPQGYVAQLLGAASNPIEPSVAAHIGLFALHTRRWSDELVTAFDLKRLRLPEIVESGSVVGFTSPESERRLTIPAGVPVVLCGSDGICSELGVGVTEPGQLYVYLGTASSIAGPIAATARELPSWPQSAGIIRMPGRDRNHDRLLGLGGAGGSAADWAASVLGFSHASVLDFAAARCAPGAAGALFLPTLAGAAAPVPSATARGGFLGLSLATGQPQLARAVLEGIAFELRWGLEALRSCGIVPREIRLTGGGARSEVWTQIIADVLQLPTLRSVDQEVGLRGAAMYGFAATDRQDMDQLAEQWLSRFGVTCPDRALAATYNRLADNYRLARESSFNAKLDTELFRTALALAEA